MLDLAELLRTCGHKVGFFSTKGQNTLPTLYEKYFIPEIDLRAPKNPWQKIKMVEHILYSIPAARNLKKLLTDFKPEVAHLHNIYYHISPSILPVLKKNKIPTVMTLHDYKLLSPNYQLFSRGKIDESSTGGHYFNCVKNRCVFNSFWPSLAGSYEAWFNAKKYINAIDLFISPSRFLKNKFVEYGWPENKIEILPNFVFPKNPLGAEKEKEDVQNEKQEEKNEKQEEKFGDYLLYFGRLSEEKGLKILLAASRLLPNIPVHIVGTGPMNNELFNEIILKQINNVKLLGYKSGLALEKEIINARMVVLPSIWYENSPLSALESMAYGKCLIASKIGGIPEIIEDNKNGILFEPGNAEYLAVQIKTIWNDEEKIKTLGLEAKKYVEENRSPERYYEGLMKIYKKITLNYKMD